MTNPYEDLERITRTLSDGQLGLLKSIAETFHQPMSGYRDPSSDVVTEQFLSLFGDVLKIHHSLSDDYLDKYRFEAALQRAYLALGHVVTRPTRNAGYDLTVDGVNWALKTQGDKKIKLASLHISKFMELGKGKWETEEDLKGLRDSFLHHLTKYERIFQLRYFARDPAQTNSDRHFYELVEIPKQLLLESQNGVFEMKVKSKQTPKPGYCRVKDAKDKRRFELYFDGGSERKLQIKHLRKDLCIVHATWSF